MYAWGFYPSAAQQLPREWQQQQQQLGGTHAPPPFVHSNCRPELIGETAWATGDNAFLADIPPTVNCGAKKWTFEEWQATGRDAGSKTGAMPSAASVLSLSSALLANTAAKTDDDSPKYHRNP